MQGAGPAGAQAGAAGQAGDQPAREGGPQDGRPGHVQDQLPGPAHYGGLVQAPGGASRVQLGLSLCKQRGDGDELGLLWGVLGGLSPSWLQRVRHLRWMQGPSLSPPSGQLSRACSARRSASGAFTVPDVLTRLARMHRCRWRRSSTGACWASSTGPQRWSLTSASRRLGLGRDAASLLCSRQRGIVQHLAGAWQQAAHAQALLGQLSPPAAVSQGMGADRPCILCCESAGAAWP